MPAYILTGAPGAGKTAVLRLLETSGYAVVEEAATVPAGPLADRVALIRQTVRQLRR